MSDHAKDGRNPPVRQGLGHYVSDGFFVRRLRFQPDVDAVLANVDRVERLPTVFVPARRTPGRWIEIPAMPGTSQPTLAALASLNGTFAQRSPLVRTAVIHRGVLAVNMSQCHREGARRDRLDATLWQFIGFRHPMPIQ